MTIEHTKVQDRLAGMLAHRHRFDDNARIAAPDRLGKLTVWLDRDGARAQFE